GAEGEGPGRRAPRRLRFAHRCRALRDGDAGPPRRLELEGAGRRVHRDPHRAQPGRGAAFARRPPWRSRPARARGGGARGGRQRLATEPALDFARKRIVWAAAALLLIAAAAGEHVSSGIGNDPLARAEALLESREPLAALVELDRLADSPRAQDAEVQIVRGK